MGDIFAVLLRRHRLRCSLTQEALAERAGISSRSIAELERGHGRSPRPRSLEQLVTALELDGQKREEFIAAGHALFWASRTGRPDRNPPERKHPRRQPDMEAAPRRLSRLRRPRRGTRPTG